MLPDLTIDNLTSDWNDGIKLSALIDAFKPGLIPDWQKLDPEKAYQNTRKAMAIAEKYFKIPQVNHYTAIIFDVALCIACRLCIMLQR